jgi:hypothetical protein
MSRDKEKQKQYNKQYHKKNYAKNREKVLAYANAHSADNIAKRKIREAANPEKYKKLHKIVDLRRHYGLDYDTYIDMHRRQEGKCAICHKFLSLALDGNKENSPHVDHNHVTGKIRGLLCDVCNRALGLFQDNPFVLLDAIRYLEIYGK